MALIETGRVCIILKGADAGKQAVIKEVVDKKFVIIAGEKVKERRSNVKHLELTAKKVGTIPKGKEVKPKEKKEQKPKAEVKAKKEKKKEKAKK